MDSSMIGQVNGAEKPQIAEFFTPETIVYPECSWSQAGSRHWQGYPCNPLAAATLSNPLYSLLFISSSHHCNSFCSPCSLIPDLSGPPLTLCFSVYIYPHHWLLDAFLIQLCSSVTLHSSSSVYNILSLCLLSFICFPFHEKKKERNRASFPKLKRPLERQKQVTWPAAVLLKSSTSLSTYHSSHFPTPPSLEGNLS